MKLAWVLALLASILIGLIGSVFDILNDKAVVVLNLTALAVFGVLIRLVQIVVDKIDQLIDTVKAAQSKSPQ